MSFWEKEKSEFWQLIGLTLILSLTQALYLLALGPLFKALFFFDSFTTEISFLALLPKNISRYLSFIDFSLRRDNLVLSIPLFLLVVSFVRSIALYTYQVKNEKIALKFGKMLRETIFSVILKLPFEKIIKKPAAQWMSYIMNDVLYVQTQLSEACNALLKDLFLVVVGIFLMFLVNWQTACVLLSTGYLISIFLGKMAAFISRCVREQQNQLALIAQRILSARKRLAFIIAQKGTAFEEQAFQLSNLLYFQKAIKAACVRVSFAPGVEFIGMIFLISTIWLFIEKNWAGSLGVDLLVFFGTLGFIMRPLRNIGEQFSKISETMGALSNVFSLLENKNYSEIDHTIHIDEKNDSFQSFLKIENIICGYEGKSLIRGDCLTLEKAKMIAIVGANGSGKSTLLKTLGGLLTPLDWQGNSEWKKFIKDVSFVGQSPFLFDGTLIENLKYSCNALEEDILVALNKVGLEQEINQLTSGIHTFFHSLNHNLSGGQIQRLVIARELLRKKNFILLDEPTSSIREEDEIRIIENLSQLAKEEKQGVICVTHRDKNLHLFDEVWFITDGKVHLKGHHTNLLKQEPYRKFFQVSHGAY